MGGSSKVPSGYQPQWQGGADQAFQSGVQALQPWASSLMGSAIPQYQALSNQITNNPYAASAQGTANNVSALGQGYVAPQDFGMSQALQQGAAPALGVAAQGVGYGQQGMGYASTGMQAAGQVLNTAFDPQQGLYNRNYQQMLDQQNAINSMSGVAGSPYGAGVTGQNANNFNLDWQDRQLARRIQGLGAYGAEQGAYGNALSGYNSSVGTYDSTLGAVGQAYTTASDLNNMGLDVYANAGMMPYETSMGILQNDVAGLNAMEQGYAGAMAPQQALLNDYLSYLHTGQAATQQAQNAAQQNNQANASFWNGMGQMGGDAISMFAMM